MTTRPRCRPNAAPAGPVDRVDLVAANVKDRPLAAPVLPIVLPADRVEDAALADRADPVDPVAALALRRNLSLRNRSA